MDIGNMAAASEKGTHSPTKRKAFIAGFPEGVRPVKRRAAKACQTCRSRKVRCDVVESGPPCNNCRLDQVQCIVSDSRRKRKPRSNGADEESESPVSSVAETDAGDLKSSSGDSTLVDQSSPTDCADRLFSNTSAGNSFELELDRHVPHMLYRTQGHRLSQDERIRRISLSTAQATHRVCLLLDAGSNDRAYKKTSVARYQQSMEALQRLREIYVSAASATSFLQAAIRRPNIPMSMSPQSSNFRTDRTKITSAAVLTPPPETDPADPFLRSPLASEQLKSSEKASPAASDDSNECASSGGMVSSDGMNNTTTGDTGLDTDFDALFNLDADMDFLAADEEEGKSATWDDTTDEPYRCGQWTPLYCPEFF